MPDRYWLCGDDCTTDCGACKGAGRPAPSPVPDEAAVERVALAEAERQAAVAALWAYRSETQHYLRGYVAPDGTHDACCAIARAREARRAEERESLNQRLRDIDGALQVLDPGSLQ